MYDILGVHFPSEGVMADQNLNHPASQGIKPLGNTRINSHSRHMSQDLRRVVLHRNFWKRDRSSSSPCTISIQSSEPRSPGEKSSPSDKPNISLEETNQHETPSSTSTDYDSVESPTASDENPVLVIPTSSLESFAGSNAKKDSREATVPKTSSSDTKLYTKSPASQKTRTPRKGKLLKVLSTRSLSKVSKRDTTKEQMDDQQLVDHFENIKQGHNNDMFHGGEGDTEQLLFHNNCSVDSESIKVNNRNHSSNKISDFSQNHRCGTCLALEQQKQRFRFLKFEFSSEKELKSHNGHRMLSENGMGDTPCNTPCNVCSCDELKKQSPEKNKSPKKAEFVLSPQQLSKSLSPESRSLKRKASKSPLKKLWNKLRSDQQ